MTTIDTRPDGAAPAAGQAPDSASRESAATSFFVGTAGWITTTDHKRIGRIYVGFGILLLLATGVLGVLLGLERTDGGGGAVVDANALLQVFQAYRVLLVLGVLAPLGLGLAVAVTPLQLGARAIAFPRLTLTGCYAWLGGMSLALVALARNGGVGGGDDQAVHMYLAGLGLAVVGLTATAGCVATSVLTTRAPGMTMRRVPLFAWSSLVGTLGLLLMLPVVLGVIVLVFVDLRLGLNATGNFGGVEGIGAWLAWPFSVPAAIVYALPAIGVAAELMPVAFKARQMLRGVAFAAIALVGVAALATTTQQFVHDVEFDTTGEAFVRGAVPFAIFAGLPLLGVTLTLLLGLGTARQGSGRPAISAPFVFALFGLLMIGAGIAGNFLQGIVDLELVDPAANVASVLEEGATIYLAYGTALAVMGGLVFWAPKLWGRTLPDAQALPLALLGALATVLAALPLYVAGFLDQVGGIPATDADVALLLSTDQVDGGTLWTLLSLIGHGLMVLTGVAFVGLLLRVVSRAGDPAEQNPYQAHTIEWSTASPAPPHNYEHVPTVASPEPQFDLVREGSPS